jgi:hypothetical protein
MVRSGFIALSFALLGCGPETEIQPVPSGQLSLTSPAPASWVDDGRYQVEGVAKGFESVTVNGQAVDVLDGAFEAEMLAERGVNLIEVSGVDGRGDTHFVRQALISGQFEAPGAAMEDSFQVRVNESGLDKAEDMVDDYVDPADLSKKAKGMNPVYEDSYGFWSWDAVTVEANLVHVGFEQPDLNLVPREDYLYIETVIPNLDIEVEVSGEIAGIDYAQPVWVSADAVVLTAEAILGADSGRITADLGDTDLSFQNFYIDTSLIPGEIEQALLGDIIREKLEILVVEKMEEAVPALLEDTLSDLDLSFELDLMGHPVSVAATFGSVGVDSQGIHANMDVQMGIPSQGNRFYKGYLAADKGVTPKKDYTSALYASVSDDLINRVLFEAWRGGMMQYALTTEDESLPAASLTNFKAEEGTISIDALLPPVLVQRNGKLSLQAGELEVLVLTPGGGLGESLKATITVFADVEMTTVNGMVKLDLGQFDVHIMVKESDWGASEEAITRVLEENLPIASLLTMVKDFEYPLPTFGDIEIASVELQRDGSGMFTNMGINLK